VPTWTDEAFRTTVAEAIAEFVPEARRDPVMIAAFIERIHYVPIDAKGTNGWPALKSLMRADVVGRSTFPWRQRCSAISQNGCTRMTSPIQEPDRGGETLWP
jgi:hypothetical protein